MKKIPLETTLVGAYRFLVTNIVSIIGTIWFPTVLVLGLLAGLVYLVVPHAWLAGDFSHFEHKQLWSAPIWLARFAVNIAALIAGSMIAVGLMRHALGLKKSATFIYFSLGAPVWRMFAAILLGLVIMVVLSIVGCLLSTAAFMFGGPLIPHAYAVAAGIAFCVVVVCFLIYVAFRLFFFLPAVVVAENRIGLGRSWSLGGGNFWRIFLVWLLVVVPVGIIAGIALEMTVLPVVVTEAMKLPHQPTPKDVVAFLRALIVLLPVIATVLILAGIAIRGLLAGAIGTAYNAVAAQPAEAAAPAEGATSA
ncbi:MAG: hypothetical protein ABSD21_07855 [Rhizomicrobium sp.]|jgi:hypothetical protein